MGVGRGDITHTPMVCEHSSSCVRLALAYDFEHITMSSITYTLFSLACFSWSLVWHISMIRQCRAVLGDVQLASASSSFVSDGFLNTQRDVLGCDADGNARVEDCNGGTLWLRKAGVVGWETLK